MRRLTTFLLVTFLFTSAMNSIMAQPLAKTSENEFQSVDLSDANDETQQSKLFSGRPGRAALYSLILPGSGQVYNKKYWKVPLVYGAIGGTTAIFIYNNNQVNELNGLIDDILSGQESSFTVAQVRARRDLARKNKQMSLVFMGIAWALNSVDAYVDAHLADFDVSDDLTLRVAPLHYVDENNINCVGIGIRF